MKQLVTEFSPSFLNKISLRCLKIQKNEKLVKKELIQASSSIKTRLNNFNIFASISVGFHW